MRHRARQGCSGHSQRHQDRRQRAWARLGNRSRSSAFTTNNARFIHANTLMSLRAGLYDPIRSRIPKLSKRPSEPRSPHGGICNTTPTHPRPGEPVKMTAPPDTAGSRTSRPIACPHRLKPTASPVLAVSNKTVGPSCATALLPPDRAYFPFPSKVMQVAQRSGQGTSGIPNLDEMARNRSSAVALVGSSLRTRRYSDISASSRPWAS